MRRRPSLRRIVEALALSGALALPVFAPRTAHASREFPQEVQDATGLTCRPGCRLCHIDDGGGPGRLNRSPFIAGLFGEAGLSPGDPTSVAPALQYLRDNQSDFDSDGTPDIEELEDGIYPASDERFCGEGAVQGPTYGCGARLAPARGGPLDPTAAMTAVLAGLGLVVLRRRYPTPRR